MFNSFENDEFNPDLSILVATAGVLEQSPEVASGMEDDVSLYSTGNGAFFLQFDPNISPANPDSALQKEPSRVWPIVTSEDWDIFLKEDLARYHWTVLDNKEFEVVRKKASTLSVSVRECDKSFDPDTVIALKRLKEGQIKPSSIVWKVRQSGNISRLYPEAPCENPRTAVLVFTVDRAIKQQLDELANIAGISRTQLLGWCLQNGLSHFPHAFKK